MIEAAAKRCDYFSFELKCKVMYFTCMLSWNCLWGHNANNKILIKITRGHHLFSYDCIKLQSYYDAVIIVIVVGAVIVFISML